MNRRILLVLASFLALSGMIAACGNDTAATDPDPTSTTEGTGGPAASELIAVADRSAPTAETGAAGAGITALGLDLYAQQRSTDPEGNASLSPASIAIALAMLEPGATGAARDQLHSLLHIDDPAAFHASMNALEQQLEARVADTYGQDEDPGEIILRIANAAYLQQGYPFLPAYLEAIGTSYGPVLREVDFQPDPDAVAHEINDFVADATNDQIVDLIGDGVIQPETVLALVNALYMKASWQETFPEDATADEPFTLLDDREVTVAMMHGSSSTSAAGDGWVAASKSYVGGLTAEFILPDEGRFEEIAASLPAVLAEFDANRTDGSTLALPRFETRTTTELTAVLRALGLTGPYEPGGLLGIADDSRLVVDKVVHEAFVAMDEEGTEAAAATVILAFPTNAPAQQPVPVVLDRPFIYRIVDQLSGATLFIGQITDPT